jgi:DNA replication protein DnaC
VAAARERLSHQAYLAEVLTAECDDRDARRRVRCVLEARFPRAKRLEDSGRRVRYVTTAALVNELVEAADDKQLSRVVGRYARIDLLCLDEVGYVHLDPRGAELLFQIITEREEKASIACASNAPFSEWGATFTDPRLAAAVVDRLTFRGHIIATGTDSYRLRATRAAKKGAAS